MRSQVGELLKRGGSSKCYSALFHTALAPNCPGSCSSPFYYVILSSPVLITSWRTGPLMLISERHGVSRLQTHREERPLWGAVMSASQPVYTMTVVTPSRSPFCQGPLTRSSLSFRQGSPLHLTPVPPRAAMSTTPPVTCLVLSPLTPSLIGGWRAELSRQWPACVKIKVGWCLLMRQT